jgi:hypothetical protein
MVARATLRQARMDWLKTYAPGRRWIAASQDHNGKPHEHLAVQNVGADGEPLKFGLREVIDMSDMKFTTAAVSAKGKGLGKSMAVYPKAKNLAVRNLAVQLFDGRGGMRADLWAGFVRDGTVCNQRTRKDGTLISFEFSGRRIRLETLRGFLQQQHSTMKGGEKDGATRPAQRSERELRRGRDRNRLVGQRARSR